MYEDSYLIPANAKKGMLILNFLRLIDAIIFGVGVAITIVLLMILQSRDFIYLIIAILPAGISALLVLPIPYYHNTLCAIQSIISFYTERRRFLWKGWCVYERILNTKK